MRRCGIDRGTPLIERTSRTARRAARSRRAEQGEFRLVGLFVIVLVRPCSGGFWLTLGGETKTYDRYRVYFHESVAGSIPRRPCAIAVSRWASGVDSLDRHNPTGLMWCSISNVHPIAAIPSPRCPPAADRVAAVN